MNEKLSNILKEFHDTKLTPIEKSTSYYIKRDDYACNNYGEEYPTGIKVRQFIKMVNNQPGAPILVGCSANSAQQIYVAAAAKLTNRKGIVFVPARKEKTSATEYALNMGAEVNEIRPGHRSVYMARAKERAKEIGNVVRWDVMGAVKDVVFQSTNIPDNISRVVIPTGSGLAAAGILAGIYLQNKNIPVLAVTVSTMAKYDNIINLAAKIAECEKDDLPELILTRHNSKYDKPLARKLPDNSVLDPFYSAKALEFVVDNDLLWLPGVRPLCAMPPQIVKKLKTI